MSFLSHGPAIDKAWNENNSALPDAPVQEEAVDTGPGPIRHLLARARRLLWGHAQPTPGHGRSRRHGDDALVVHGGTR